MRKVHSIQPNWRLLYNIGQSEASAKRHGLALEAFEEYLAEAGDDLTKLRRDEVLSEIERLREMVGEVSIRAPKGAVVHLDDVERGTTPLAGPMMVSAGKKHRLVVKQGEEILLDRQVKVSGGKSLKIEVGSTAEGPPAAFVADADDKEPEVEDEMPTDDAGPLNGAGKLKTAGWIVGGMGGAMLAVGGITGAVALKKDKQLADDCSDDQCGPYFHDENDKMGRMALAADILIAVGGAALVAGVVLIIVGKKKESGSEENAA